MKLLTLILSLLVGLGAAAEVSFVRLKGQAATFAIPRRASESTAVAFAKYKEFIQNHPELVSEFETEALEKLEIEREIPKTSLTNKPLVLTLANRDYDQMPMEKTGFRQRLGAIAAKLPNSNAVTLPIAALGRFSLQEKPDLMSEIHSAAASLIAVGGPDVDPDTYHTENKSSRETNLIRDQEELFILKYWIDRAEKPLIGICRGHQMIAVAYGFKLIQHKEGHGDGSVLTHPIFLLPTKNMLLAKAAQSELIIVNSFHHQAVDPHAPLSVYQKVEVAAVAGDGTIESIESKNGLVWTFQFHPEFMQNKLSDKIFSAIQNRNRPLNTAVLCHKVWSTP